MNGIWIKLYNSLGCEIASHFVPENQNLTLHMCMWLERDGIELSDGDHMTFTEGWSEL